MKSAPVTHVIFDVDGLLLDTESVYTAVTCNLLKDYGLKLTYDLKRKIMGRKPLDAATALVDGLSAPFSPEEWLSLFNSRLTAERWHAVPSLPGADRLVLHLARHKIPMAAATGCCSHELKQKMLNHSDILNSLEHYVASGDDASILNGKPAPDIFIAAAKRFRQAPASCESVLVFEDSPLGVQAAAAANMRVVWVPCEDEPPADAPENVPMADRELVTRINSLVDFQPEKFGLPAFD